MTLDRPAHIVDREFMNSNRPTIGLQEDVAPSPCSCRHRAQADRERKTMIKASRRPFAGICPVRVPLRLGRRGRTAAVPLASFSEGRSAADRQLLAVIRPAAQHAER